MDRQPQAESSPEIPGLHRALLYDSGGEQYSIEFQNTAPNKFETGNFYPAQITDIDRAATAKHIFDMTRERGLSLNSAADLCRLSPSTLVRAAGGKTMPDFRTASLIDQTLGSYLLCLMFQDPVQPSRAMQLLHVNTLEYKENYPSIVGAYLKYLIPPTQTNKAASRLGMSHQQLYTFLKGRHAQSLDSIKRHFGCLPNMRVLLGSITIPQSVKPNPS